jgi:hypothetical protein
MPHAFHTNKRISGQFDRQHRDELIARKFQSQQANRSATFSEISPSYQPLTRQRLVGAAGLKARPYAEVSLAKMPSAFSFIAFQSAHE